jgi:phosphatidylserine/phosphatidylglycerophosphate/cardiolipin synthase-like enzyme
MDIRSFRLNFEVGVALYEPVMAEQIINYIEGDIRRAKRLQRKDPTRTEALKDGIGRALSLVL